MTSYIEKSIPAPKAALGQNAPQIALVTIAAQIALAIAAHKVVTGENSY